MAECHSGVFQEDSSDNAWEWSGSSGATLEEGEDEGRFESYLAIRVDRNEILLYLVWTVVLKFCPADSSAICQARD